METESLKQNKLLLLNERDNQGSLTKSKLTDNKDRVEPPSWAVFETPEKNQIAGIIYIAREAAFILI